MHNEGQIPTSAKDDITSFCWFGITRDDDLNGVSGFTPHHFQQIKFIPKLINNWQKTLLAQHRFTFLSLLLEK